MNGNALPFLWARGLLAAAATWKALLLALPTFSPLALLLWLAGRLRHRVDDRAA